MWLVTTSSIAEGWDQGHLLLSGLVEWPRALSYESQSESESWREISWYHRMTHSARANHRPSVRHTGEVIFFFKVAIFSIGKLSNRYINCRIDFLLGLSLDLFQTPAPWSMCTVLMLWTPWAGLLLSSVSAWLEIPLYTLKSRILHEARPPVVKHSNSLLTRGPGGLGHHPCLQGNTSVNPWLLQTQ